VDDLGALWLLVLQLRYLVRDLGLVVPARLNRALGIPDLLQNTAVVFQILGKDIFLLSQLREQHPELIRYVRDRVVARSLAPVRQLGGDRDTFAAGAFVGANSVVLTLDYLKELLA